MVCDHTGGLGHTAAGKFSAQAILKVCGTARLGKRVTWQRVSGATTIRGLSGASTQLRSLEIAAQIGPHSHETSGEHFDSMIFTFAVPSFFLEGKGITLTRISPLPSDFTAKSLTISKETL